MEGEAGCDLRLPEKCGCAAAGVLLVRGLTSVLEVCSLAMEGGAKTPPLHPPVDRRSQRTYFLGWPGLRGFFGSELGPDGSLPLGGVGPSSAGRSPCGLSGSSGG